MSNGKVIIIRLIIAQIRKILYDRYIKGMSQYFPKSYRCLMET